MGWHTTSRAWRAAYGLVLISTLAACGGDDGTQASTPTPAAVPGLGRKVLLIGVDGATYPQIQSALVRKTMPSLAQLTVAPTSTGGLAGTMTEQSPLDGPSWATVLSGSWVNRHGVTDDSGLDDGTAAGSQADSVFRYFRAAGGNRKLASVTSSTLLPPLLQADSKAGNLDTAVDCAGVDSCVTANTVKLVQSGYDLVFAQYHAPAAAAAADGYVAGTYAAALSHFDKSLGDLLAAVAERQWANANEDWLVMVTTSHGLDRTGATTSVPTIQNRTAFLALNRGLNTAFDVAGAPAPDSASALSKLPTEADIVPTLLAHARIDVPAASRKFDGTALTGAPGVQGLVAGAGDDSASVTLKWTNPATPADSITALRDGVQIATLAGDATAYEDNTFDLATGLYRFNYTLVRNGIATSYLAQLNYARPTPLAATLRNAIALYYSFDALPPADTKAGSTVGPWVGTLDGGSLRADNFKSNALQVSSATDSYQLTQNGSDIALSPQFTIGFWYRTDCTQGNSVGAPVLSNKNYVSGANAGIAVGLFGSCELRFNIGSGGKRDDINGMAVTANQWAYIALSVDAVAKQFSAYVIDPVRGVQKTENKAIANTDVTKLNGMATMVWGLNDDATHNYVGNNAGALKGTMAFNDLAMWTRVLTLDELLSINASHQPLSTLNP
jgi:hypothetical protein